MLTDRPSAELDQLRELLFRQLTERIVPFWLDHALGQSGGLNNCIGDDGVIVSRDKWLWSQWRAVWVFSKLHNRFGPNDRWLAQRPAGIRGVHRELAQPHHRRNRHRSRRGARTRHLRS